MFGPGPAAGGGSFRFPKCKNDASRCNLGCNEPCALCGACVAGVARAVTLTHLLPLTRSLRPGPRQPSLYTSCMNVTPGSRRAARNHVRGAGGAGGDRRCASVLGRRCSIKLALLILVPRVRNVKNEKALERDKLCVKSQPLKRVPRYTRVRRGARVSYP